MASRRGHGEGSIYQRKSDGRWVGSVDLGYVNGKRKRKVIYGETRKGVSEQLKAALRDQQQGLLPCAPRQTVAQFLDAWLKDVVKPSVRPRTFHSYDEIVQLRLKPALGRHNLAKLTPQHVQQMMNAKLEAGLAPRTVAYLRDVLRNALGQPLTWGLVNRNVATLVEAPRVPHHEMHFLSPEEARCLLTAARENRLEALYGVALALELRQGESLGLRWQDIDFAAGTLCVRFSLQRIDGALQLVEPKTAQSRRTLTMPPTVREAVERHRDRQDPERAIAGDRWVDTGLVFTTPKGTALDARNVVRGFKLLLAQAGLSGMRWQPSALLCISPTGPERSLPRCGGGARSLPDCAYDALLARHPGTAG